MEAWRTHSEAAPIRRLFLLLTFDHRSRRLWDDESRELCHLCPPCLIDCARLEYGESFGP